MLLAKRPDAAEIVRPFIGSDELIKGKRRYCLWINEENLPRATKIDEVASRIEAVRRFRSSSKKGLTQSGAATPHLFQQIRQRGDEAVIVVPSVSSEI